MKKERPKMKVDKIYKLSCHGLNGFYETDFYSLREEALEQLEAFKELIREEDENQEEIGTEIILHSIKLDYVDDLLYYSFENVVSKWVESEENKNYCKSLQYAYWKDNEFINRGDKE